MFTGIVASAKEIETIFGENFAEVVICSEDLSHSPLYQTRQVSFINTNIHSSVMNEVGELLPTPFSTNRNDSGGVDVLFDQRCGVNELQDILQLVTDFI